MNASPLTHTLATLFHHLSTDSNSIVMAASSSSDVPMTESDQKNRSWSGRWNGREATDLYGCLGNGRLREDYTCSGKVLIPYVGHFVPTHSHRYFVSNSFSSLQQLDKLPVQEESTSLCDQPGPSVSGSSLSCQCRHQRYSKLQGSHEIILSWTKWCHHHIFEPILHKI